MKRNTFVLLVLVTFSIAVSCSDDSPTNPAAAPWMALPHVEAIAMTDAAGARIGVFGPGKLSSTLDAYPNPFLPGCVVPYGVSDSGTVAIWVVAAVGPGETDAEVLGRFPTLHSHLTGSVELKRLTKEAWPGTYSVEIFARYPNGDLWPPGYYRVYVFAGGKLDWSDILLRGVRGECAGVGD